MNAHRSPEVALRVASIRGRGFRLADSPSVSSGHLAERRKLIKGIVISTAWRLTARGDRFKYSQASVRLLPILISQNLCGDFCNHIGQQQIHAPGREIRNCVAEPTPAPSGPV